jgi:hypothetical protein
MFNMSRGSSRWGAIDDVTGEVAAGESVTARPALIFPLWPPLTRRTSRARIDKPPDYFSRRLVNVDDFPPDAVGKAIPYGIYDVAADREIDDFMTVLRSRPG